MCLLLSPPARLPEPFAQNTHLTDTCPSAPVASHVGVDERRRLVATIEVARVENREGGALRACVGVGIAVPTRLGRLELNLTHVLRRQPTDSLQRNGWQIGMSAGLS